MSAGSVPRPLLGLAAAVLVGGLTVAPLVGYAQPTTSPSPASPSPASPSARATTATTQPASPSAGAGSASPTATPFATQEPTASQTESADPESGTSESDESPSPNSPPENGVPSGGDARPQAAAAAEGLAAAEQAGEERVQAQAEGPAAISLSKSASPARVSKVGQVVTYQLTATNTGSIELTNVLITDELDGLSDLDCNQPLPAVLAPEGPALQCTATLTVTQDWLDFGDIDNSATVFGNYTVEGQSDYVGANASAHVAVDQKPSVALDASVSPRGTVDAGDRLRFDATATNTGNVTLTAARITSSLSPLDLDCEPSARATLAPGATISCSGSYRVTSGDARRGRVSNTVTARAERPYGDPASRGDDVTDDTRLQVAVHKLADESIDTGLADTGGPGDALPVGAVGIAALAAGAALLRRSLRR